MGPLEGVKVIDMTSVLMGALCDPDARRLRGADIIKIESLEGDVTRLERCDPASGMGPVFLNTNRSTRSFCLDLKKPAGRDALLRPDRVGRRPDLQRAPAGDGAARSSATTWSRRPIRG